MSTAGVIQTLNQLLTTKYPTLFMILMVVVFAWFTTSQLNSVGHRVEQIENIDLPGIRQDIKEIRQDIRALEMRVTRIEVKVDYLTAEVQELKVEVAELRDEVKEIRTDVKTILTILSAKKGP